MEVASFGTTRADFPNLLMNCVKAMGRDITSSPQNEAVKYRISYIHRIAVLDWDRGIFQITFAGGGNTRHHRLSQARVEELKDKNSFDQVLISRAAEEIVKGMGFFQQTITLSKEYAQRFREKIQTRDGSIQTMLDKSGVTDVFSFSKEKSEVTIVVMKNRDHFAIDSIFQEIMTPADYNSHLNHKLLDQYAHSPCYAQIIQANPLEISFSLPEDKNALLNEIRQRFLNPDSGMASYAKEYFQEIVRVHDPRTFDGQCSIMGLNYLFALITYSDSIDKQKSKRL